jgi:hypothetical protein
VSLDTAPLNAGDGAVKEETELWREGVGDGGEGEDMKEK